MPKELTIDDCRPAVLRFAIAMEQKLRVNDFKGGWSDCTYEYLANCIGAERKELETELEWFRNLNRAGSPEIFERKRQKAIAAQDEAVDVANFAMMIHDNIDTEISSDENKINKKKMKRVKHRPYDRFRSLDI